MADLTTIRLATADDLASLPAIENAAATIFVGIELPPAAPAETWTAAQSAGTLWVVDDQDGKPAAFLAAKVADTVLHIDEIDVTPALQRRGIGRRLMQTALACARQRGLPTVTLTTFRDIPWNAPFYASLGFVEIAADGLPPRLAAILALEVRLGLDPKRRCAMSLSLRPSQSTRLIRAGRAPARLALTVGPPIQKGSTVLIADAASLYDETRPTYGRGGLATQDALMSALAELEGAKAVRLFPSGLAAMTGAMLAVLKAGDDVLVTDAIYKPTRRFCDRVLRRFGVTVRYYDPRTAPADLVAMASPATRLIVLESPGSLTMEMQDAPAIAKLAKAAGILTLMDNTWAAGLYFKPLERGIDLSIQALTKYVGGHSDVFMGCAATADDQLAEALDQAIWDFGWAVAPEDAYQMLRGLRTLPTRMACHQASGLAVAAWLADQSQVGRVLHPALPGAPDHDLWRRDFTGAAGLFAVVLKPCAAAAAHAFLDALRLFGLGFSWGGFESLALDCDPQFSVRAQRPAFTGPVVRLNIGLEDPDDLIADLARALKVLDES